MSQYQANLLADLRRQHAAEKAKGIDNKGLADRIEYLQERYEADEAARENREARQKAEAEAKAKAREAAEDAELIPLLKPEFMALPGASEADFKRAYPHLKELHLRKVNEARVQERVAAIRNGTLPRPVSITTGKVASSEMIEA